ncbi:MAG: Rsd/AlgQ family anti-sigma factor [Proteobacteria bacterium]|nr:Rsd/AlgQ family anti-sigma factor [Pseudomonadota bacterium]
MSLHLFEKRLTNKNQKKTTRQQNLTSSKRTLYLNYGKKILGKLMLPAFKTQKNNSRLIHQWLKERQELTVVLSQLCNFRPFCQTDQNLLWGTLQEFCQIVVDYLSLGHFEVYEHLSSIVEADNIQISHNLLQVLMNNTVDILGFNDKYQSQLDLINLDRHLSKLAFHIAQRFEWEDKLLATYNFCRSSGSFSEKIA